MSETSWSFSSVWNRSLEKRDEKEAYARDNIWASELGGAFIDRYLKMKGVPPSNPYDPRSLRKFEAGRIFEWIVEMVLLRAGVLINKQETVEFAYPGLLKVRGRLDHLAGGTPDYEKVRAQIETEFLPDFIKRTALAVIDYFSKEYPSGLKPIVIEVKSVGSLMFHRYETFKVADNRHALQLYHYLKGKDMPEGHIVYISKDDLCLAEIGVFNNSPLEELYKKDIEAMTNYFKSNTEPPKEQEITFDEVTGKFAVNWKISYSSYLTRVYGFKNQEDFEAKVSSRVARWNRVLGRLAGKKEMTADNKNALKEMELSFPGFAEKLFNGEGVKNDSSSNN